MAFLSYFRKEQSNRMRSLLLLFFPMICFIGVYLSGDYSIWDGLLRIVTSPALLIQDSLSIGGISGALLNAGFISLINIVILFAFDVNFNGMLLASFFTVFGFSFIGMNFVNVLPIYFGGYIYSVYAKISYKNIALVAIFAACLAPIVTHSFFGFNLDFYSALLVAIIKGSFIGFFIVPLASHMLRFHDGFNLYNVGFTAGIIAIVYATFYRSFFGPISFESLVYQEQNSIIISLTLVSAIYFIVLGFLSENNLLAKWQDINKSSGRLVSDFTYIAGFGPTYFNMGILGIFSFIVVFVLKGTYNGPVLAGIFTIMGFGAFGKHLFNIIPVMLGTLLGAFFLGYNVSSSSVVVPVLFVTTIAPIAGIYGIVWGLVAGFLHMVSVGQFGGFHAGMNLYNNGFTGGMIAGFLVPIINVLRRKKNER